MGGARATPVRGPDYKFRGRKNYIHYSCFHLRVGMSRIERTVLDQAVASPQKKNRLPANEFWFLCVLCN